MKILLGIGIGALLGSSITYKYLKNRYWEMSRELYDAELECIKMSREIEHIKKYSTKKNYYD